VSINFPPDLAERIERYRRAKERIPTFTAAVRELVEMGLRAAERGVLERDVCSIAGRG
jgi:hypothetical protein